jgi:hypothetical protein
MAVRTVPHRVPYIHPAQRTLTSNQIGPSAHKNAFHVGVLDGNWSEERSAFDRQQMQTQFAGGTTMKCSYTAPPADSLRGPSSELVPAVRAELEKPAFFSAHDQTLLTSNELFYTDLAAGPAMKTDKVIKVDGQSARNGFVEKKRAQWADETNPWNCYKTTKGTSIDASGQQAVEFNTRRELSGQPHHINKWGGVARELSQTYHSMQLREPIQLVRSPFA